MQRAYEHHFCLKWLKTTSYAIQNILHVKRIQKYFSICMRNFLHAKKNFACKTVFPTDGWCLYTFAWLPYFFQCFLAVLVCFFLTNWSNLHVCLFCRFCLLQRARLDNLDSLFIRFFCCCCRLSLICLIYFNLLCIITKFLLLFLTHFVPASICL